MKEPTYHPSASVETLTALFSEFADLSTITVPRLALWELLVEHARQSGDIARLSDEAQGLKVAALEANMRAAARFAVMLPSEKATEMLIHRALSTLSLSGLDPLHPGAHPALLQFSMSLLHLVGLVKSRSHGGDADWVAADGARLVPAPPETSASSGPQTFEELGGTPA